MTRFWAVFILTAGLALAAAYAPAQAQQGAWQTRLLANGMELNYRQDTTRQLLHLGLTLRGGASLDPSDAQGMAKLYEQLFFQRLPDSTPAALAADQGLFLSHKTLLESHFFGMSLPPAQLPAALYLLTHGLEATAWSDSTIVAARDALVPALQAQDFAPESHLAADLRETLWRAFASRKQLAGRYADILRLGSERIWNEIGPYHHPANCILAATGPSPAAEFFSAAEASLRTWQPNSQGAILPKVELPRLSQSIYFQTVNEFAAHPLIMIAWPVASGENPLRTARDAEHFCTLAALRQGQMYRHLVDSGLVNSFEWTWEGGVNPGQLLLSVIPETNRFADCMKALQAEIAQLGNANRYTAEEVAVANRHLQLQAAQLDDHSIPRLIEQGRTWMMRQDNEPEETQVQLADIQGFAAKHLAGKPHVAGLLLNSESAWALNADSLFQPSVGAAVAVVTPVEPIKPLKSIAPATLQKMRVHFDATGANPDSASIGVLRELAGMLHDQTDKRLYLNSFAEGEGDGVLNYQLTVSRAKNIRKWLVEQAGVPAQQVVIRAYGEAFPEFADEKDLRNRRLTFEYAPADAQDNAF